MIFPCPACAKTIDEQTPACAACGVRQPEPHAGAGLRTARLALTLLAAVAAGFLCGLEFRFGHLRGERSYADAHPGKARAGLLSVLREKIEESRAQNAPFAELEDVLLDPGRFANERVTVIAYLFSVKTPGASTGRLMVGWGNGATLDLDLSALPEAERIRALGWVDQPRWVAARGKVERGSRDPVLVLDSLEFTAQPNAIDTVPDVLGDG